MKRVLAIVLSMIMTMGAIAYAIDSNSETDEPTATEAPTVAPSTEEADITVDPETGEPEIEVKGTILIKDVDYVLSYRDNVNVGTATVVVTFIGNYAGMREQTFNIIPKPTAKPSSGGGGGGSSRSGGGGGSVSLSSRTAQPTPEPEYTYHEAYVNGYETDNGTVFRPDAYMTRAEAAAMLSRVIQPDISKINISFNDVNKNEWFYDAVTQMAEAGVIKGYDNNLFRPYNRITRAELVVMLIRSKNIDAEKYVGVPFNDITADMWSADYIYTAYKLKYIDGYADESFKPDNAVTRAEAVKIINGVLGRNDYKNEINPFSDLSENHWAYKFILEAAVAHKFESGD